MNLDNLKSRRFEATRQTYDWRDSAYYALALGMGSDPLDEDELLYVYEGREQRAVPSQCVTLAWLPIWQDDPAAGLQWMRILHGEQSFQLHRPVPTHGSVYADHRVVAVEDKGAGRGALIHVTSELHDEADGSLLATLQSVQFARDDGGAGSFGHGTPPLAPLPTHLTPSASIEYRTIPQAALIYRLASRDYMSIHVDPAAAKRAGFERPISHGLNTLGVGCRAVLKHAAAGRPELLKSLSVRFVSPGQPGDTIRVDLFDDGDRVRFRATALERDVLLLDRGECTLAQR